MSGNASPACWIIEAVDAYGKWSLVDAIGGGSEFMSKIEAEGAMDDLVYRNNWSPSELRVRAIYAD